jgi:hypothetical protein
VERAAKKLPVEYDAQQIAPTSIVTNANCMTPPMGICFTLCSETMMMFLLWNHCLKNADVLAMAVFIRMFYS